jgi:hypothetical protein
VYSPRLVSVHLEVDEACELLKCKEDFLGEFRRGGDWVLVVKISREQRQDGVKESSAGGVVS